MEVYNNDFKYLQYSEDLQYIINSETSLKNKYLQLKGILERLCKDLTQNESLQFPSLFSRIVFISQKFKLTESLEWQLQNIRVKSTFLLKDGKNVISDYQFNKAIQSLENFLSVVFKNEIKNEVESDEISNNKREPLHDKIKGQIISIDRENKSFIISTDSEEGSKYTIKCGVEKINEIFDETINRMWIGVQVNLIDCIVDQNNHLIPRFIVLEPDYLLDASALAECFQNYGISHLHYFRRKFEETANSQYILLGNLANFFLDELIYSNNPSEAKFEDSFLSAFKQFPFEFTSCNDIKNISDFKDFMVKSRTQFENIKRVIVNDFPINNINPLNCTLEPSFFCEKFGIQGRLDLLQNGDNLNIVELKSGGLPYPKYDSRKIAKNHEAQTTIYRLIIQTVFNKSPRNISATILYSAAENQGENLRLSATYQTLEKEIINIRNLIVATEHDLYLNENNAVESLLAEISNLNNYPFAPQFFIDKLYDFEKLVSTNITPLEKKYFHRFISFISRELYIHKTGDGEYSTHTGTASLWNTSFLERKEAFELLSDLKIISIDEAEYDMKIRFSKSQESNFTNFRKGEICIVYPHEKEMDSILNNQILKGTIAEINANDIIIRFRYKQKNKDYLYKYETWAIEHDYLDHSYSHMFKGITNFLKSTNEKRSLLLGITPPFSTYNYTVQNTETTTSIENKQNQVIEKAIAAKDYFLIVGPPGTGKTSIFARKLIEELYANPNNNILVMAYTNRAVDELCDAICSAFDCKDRVCNNYIRIGAELSCEPQYKDRLLQNIAKNVKSRDELRHIINKCRVYVGTVASIIGKPEIFDMKKFDVAIIDEASQILEPQIIGLLTKFDKFIMIGDHKQLSTITLQSPSHSNICDTELNNLELFDCRESYFERLYRICQKNDWITFYDTLIYQGRMHEDIASFPNRYFYDNKLYPVLGWQSQSLIDSNNNSDSYQKLIDEHRYAFIPCVNSYSINDKINEKEAEIAVKLCRSIIDAYKRSEKDFSANTTLGIITPYRNQIALIKHKLELTGIEELSNIMVDTVERYQGSQRDIIIISFCMNRTYQLDFFCNMNREKNVDRKLNVALTRARQQLFMIGNEYILSQNPIYRELLNTTTKIHL